MLTCIEMLLDHNIVCREPILETIEKMDPQYLTKEPGVERSSIRDVLVHLMNTELYWVTLLKEEKTEYLEPSTFTDIESIRRKWCEIEEQTVEFIKNLHEDQLFHVRNVRRDIGTISFTVSKALIHMLTHEIHHRGVLVELIQQLGSTPPDVNML